MQFENSLFYVRLIFNLKINKYEHPSEFRFIQKRNMPLYSICSFLFKLMSMHKNLQNILQQSYHINCQVYQISSRLYPKIFIYLSSTSSQNPKYN